jgi:uncharacterized membrane protein
VIDLLIFIMKIFYGIFFMLFLPGFSLLLLLFRKKEMGILERMALSPVFSVIIIFLLIVFPEYIGIDLTSLNMFLMTSFFTVVCLFLWAIKSGKVKKIFCKKLGEVR